MFGQNSKNMKDIKQVVRENLNKKIQINESFERIFLQEDEEKRFGLTIDYLGGLIDEGYSNDDIENVIEEQLGWLRNLFGGSSSNAEDQKTHDSLGGTAMKGGWSQFKEWMIGKFLNLIGFEGPLANAVATAFSEMSVMDLISVFRSREGCMQNSGPVAKALIESITRYIIESNTQKDSVAYNFLRNSLFEYFHSEGYDQKVGNFLCNAAYKAKGAVTSQLPSGLSALTGK